MISDTQNMAAYWAGQDAGDRHMRKEGRRTWSIDDWNYASKVFKETYAKLTASVSTENK